MCTNIDPSPSPFHFFPFLPPLQKNPPPPNPWECFFFTPFFPITNTLTSPLSPPPLLSKRRDVSRNCVCSGQTGLFPFLLLRPSPFFAIAHRSCSLSHCHSVSFFLVFSATFCDVFFSGREGFLFRKSKNKNIHSDFFDQGEALDDSRGTSVRSLTEYPPSAESTARAGLVSWSAEHVSVLNTSAHAKISHRANIAPSRRPIIHGMQSDAVATDKNRHSKKEYARTPMKTRRGTDRETHCSSRLPMRRRPRYASADTLNAMMPATGITTLLSVVMSSMSIRVNRMSRLPMVMQTYAYRLTCNSVISLRGAAMHCAMILLGKWVDSVRQGVCLCIGREFEG